MRNIIRKYFHQSNKDELEAQIEALGYREINWIIDNVKEANGDEKDFQITNMKYKPENKSIDLKLKEKSSGERINKELIL